MGSSHLSLESKWTLAFHLRVLSQKKRKSPVVTYPFTRKIKRKDYHLKKKKKDQDRQLLLFLWIKIDDYKDPGLGDWRPGSSVTFGT